MPYPFASSRVGAAVLGIALIVASGPARADEQDVKSAIVEQVRELTQATAAGDLPAVLERTHPNVIEMSGGPEAFLGMLQALKALTDAMQLEFVEPFTVSDVVENGGKQWAVVSFDMIYAAPDGTRQLLPQTATIAMSVDGGTSWYFTNVTDELRPHLNKVLPDFPTLELPLPPSPKPRLVNPASDGGR